MNLVYEFPLLIDPSSDAPLICSQLLMQHQMMKEELTRIRPILDTMGPLVSSSASSIAKDEEDDEDCNVEDIIESSNCVDGPRGGEYTATNVSIDTTTTNDANENETEETTLKPLGIPIFHVNTNRFPQVGARNKIRGLPTLVLFLKGVEVWRGEGMVTGEDMLKCIDEALENGLDSVSALEEIDLKGGVNGDAKDMVVKRKGRRLGG